LEKAVLIFSDSKWLNSVNIGIQSEISGTSLNKKESKLKQENKKLEEKIIDL